MSGLLTIHRRETVQLNPADFLASFPSFVLQYLDDSAARDRRKALTAIRYSPEVASRKQAEGCGVYFAPNAFDGRRRMERLLKIQAVYLDIDAAKERDGLQVATIEERKERSLIDLLVSEPRPHAVIETKNGLQPVWLVDTRGIKDALSLFREAMAMLLRRFGGDPAAKDATRLLRLPGSLHLKNPADPFRCRLLWNELDCAPHDIQGIIDAFYVPPTIEEPRPTTAHTPVNPYDSLDVADVVIAAAREAGIAVCLRRNADGSRQIVEDGEVTSGFISSRGNFAYSSSGKERKGGPAQLVQYYLNVTRDQAKRWLAEHYRLESGGARPSKERPMACRSEKMRPDSLAFDRRNGMCVSRPGDSEPDEPSFLSST